MSDHLTESLPVTLLTVADVAQLLQVPPKSIYSWRSKGEGPPGFRVGRHVRFDPADVRAWMDRQRAAEQSPAPDLAAAADSVRIGGRRPRRTTGDARPSPARTAAVSSGSRSATGGPQVPDGR